MSFEDDDGLSAYVGELLEAGYLEGAEQGVAKRFLDGESLSQEQQKVFDRYIIAKNDPGRCIRGAISRGLRSMRQSKTAACADTAHI